MVLVEQYTGKNFEEIEFVLIEVLLHNIPGRTVTWLLVADVSEERFVSVRIRGSHCCDYKYYLLGFYYNCDGLLMVADVSEELVVSMFFSNVDRGNTLLWNIGKDMPTRLQGAIPPS
jgi:hypothetical protein